MNTTANSFFIVDCSKELSTALPRARAGELSARLYHTIGAMAERRESFEQAARRLLRLAELAHGARDTDALREISLALQTIPFEPAQRAATYYAAILAKHSGDIERASDLLSPLTAPRAIQTLATVRKLQGQWSEATYLHAEAMRRARDVDGLALVNARAQLAIIKSSAGDHHGALADLQELWPMVRVLARTHPHLYPQWCNALALELAAVGNLDAARRAVAVAVSAPIAEAYPEWHETLDELRELERAAVAMVVSISKPRATPRTITPGRACWSSVISHQSLVIGHRSAVSHHPRARAPGITERVKRSARDRDGPFVNVK
jgi:hypothetical protein